MSVVDSDANLNVGAAGSSVDSAAVTALQDVVYDVVESMKTAEVQRMPNIKTMDTQPEYQWFMRPQLLGFLIESQMSLSTTHEVFSLAVNILDRYASRRIINRRHYQLVGATSLWIAAKFLDNKCRAPIVKDIEYLCAGAFTPQVICEMELHILSALDWEISAPTAVEFVDIVIGQLFSQGAPLYPDPAIYSSIAKHICECALFKRDLLVYLPSVVAATAVEIACVVGDVVCGINRQFQPVPSSDRHLFDELASLILAPPQHMELRSTAHGRIDVVSLLAHFVRMNREEFEELPPPPSRHNSEWEDSVNASPYSSCSEWGSNSPATTIDTSSPHSPLMYEKVQSFANPPLHSYF